MPNRRFLPRAEPLEVRAVPATTVILADIDTPMAQLSSFGTVPNWGLPNMPLGDYLLPGMDFRGTTPVPAIPSSGPSHGTYMGGRYALSMIQAGQTPLV